MAKQVAVVAVNPVNGAGLFQYLEAFYENQIPWTLFAVSGTPQLTTNSGISFTADDVIASLKGREAEFDALVFACGDAIPKFAENASAPWNQDLMAVIAAFGEQEKMLIGHCAAGMLFDMAGVAGGRKLAVHPFVKGLIQNGTATDAPYEADGRFCTAQTENTVGQMIPTVVEMLK